MMHLSNCLCFFLQPEASVKFLKQKIVRKIRDLARIFELSCQVENSLTGLS